MANWWQSRIVGHGKIDPETLQANPLNHRLHPKKQRDVVRDSIVEIGFIKSVLVNKTTGLIVDGHERVHQAIAAKKENPSLEIDVEYIELTPAEEAKALAVLDASSELAEIDAEQLEALLNEFETNSESLTGLLNQLAEESGIKNDAIEPEEVEAEVSRADELQKEWKTQRGQKWLISGKQSHVLVCGDSCDQRFVDLCTSDVEHIDSVITDPPYGVSYVGKTKDKLPVHNDGQETLDLLLQTSLGFAFEKSRKGACWYVFAPSGLQFYNFATVLKDLGIWRQTIAWVKNSLVMGHSDYHYQHESIFYGWKEGAAHQTPPDRKQTTVWNFDRPTQSREHPTMKPVDLVGRTFEFGTQENEINYDPFLGSGTTMLVAEQMNRRCVGIELSESYCAVILQRMKTAGCKCELLDSIDA